MGIKSSGELIGTLILVALVGWYKYDNWQAQMRVREFFRAPSILSMRSQSESKRSQSRNEALMEKEHIDSMRKASERCDFDEYLAVVTNVPNGVSAEYRDGIKANTDFIQRFRAFMAEINARLPTEGLDLDLALSPRFICGANGFEASLQRVDMAISFMNEVEDGFKGFIKEVDSSPIPKVKEGDLFDFTPQRKKMMDSMTSSCKIWRQMAGQIKKLVILHRAHPQDWKLDGEDILYYDAHLCDQVNSVRKKLLELSEECLRLENILSATQKEFYDKLGKACDKSISR